jgi:hypothetical protein
MKAASKIILELFGPSVFGGLLMMLFGLINSPEPPSMIGLLTLPVLSVFFVFSAIIICGIQSICYTIFMEIAFSRGLIRRSWQSIAYSTLLGALSGISFIFYSIPGTKASISSLALYSLVGAIVGLVISSLIYWREPIIEQVQI